MKPRHTFAEIGLLVKAVLLLGGGTFPAPAAEAPTRNSPAQAGQLARFEMLRDWQLTKLLRDYHENGHHDPKWDAAVERAISAFADLNARRSASLTYTQAAGTGSVLTIDTPRAQTVELTGLCGLTVWLQCRCFPL